MAPKRASPLDDPPACSTSGEEVVSSEEEEEEGEDSSESGSGSGSEEEGDEPEQPKVVSLPAGSRKKQSSVSFVPVESKSQAAKSSSSGSESGSESESESVPEESQPLRIRHADSDVKLNNPQSKKSRSKPAATPARRSAKRQSQNEDNDSKKAKRKLSVPEPEKEELKKPGEDSRKIFQRVWSEEDETIILKGMLDYTAKKGADPTADMNTFFDFIKKSFHFDVSKAQLSDKIRRLKKKYMTTASKENKFRPMKPLEQQTFDLSKKIWGDGEGVSRRGMENLRSSGKVKNEGNDSVQISAERKVEFVASPLKEVHHINAARNPDSSVGLDEMSCFDITSRMIKLPEHVVRLGLELISESKKVEIQEKWKKQHVAELKLFAERAQLFSEQAKLIIEAYNN